ncbi:MAG TPA: hypothetical protein PKA63_02825 [Oligoflexia bacterium]|nr:hypothetical protein [Oligoflexia bacterium]HMP47587.1 hypothetical protein [Oligoflexia bacterium]
MNINLSPDEDERALLKLRDEMSDKQRQDMAEIIQNELKRRESMTGRDSGQSNASYRSSGIMRGAYAKSKVPASKLSSGLDSEDLAGIYKDSDQKIQELRVRALESRLNEAKKEVTRLGKAGSRIPNKSVSFDSLQFGGFSRMVTGVPVLLIVATLVTLGVLKFTKGGMPGSLISNSQTPSSNSSSRASLSGSVNQTNIEVMGDLPLDGQGIEKTGERPGNYTNTNSQVERGLLLQLDQRRVELEQRKQILDEKERELQTQAKLVSEKVTELKALVSKLGSLRKDKDHKYEARMEQLASVYSAMAPNEAANLISKLDDEVGLGLLERMPGKRMAQILGVMEQSRALDLTKSLTNRKKL